MSTAHRPILLVVDDQPAIATLYARVLEGAGYTARAAFSAREGCAMAARTPPDGMLVDLQMPCISGLGLLRRVRATGPFVPVAIMTAASQIDREMMREIVALGATVHFKPFSCSHLQRVARELIVDVPSFPA